LIQARPKFGKTTFGASLNEFTKKTLGKETLFIAVEAAEGGGTSSIRQFDVPFVQPENWQTLDKLLASLQTDTDFGGVVVDNATDMVNRIVKPYALTFPVRGTPPATRLLGVPHRDDYQTMGEITRKIFNQLINLTKSPDPKHRKHLLVTVLEKERTDQDTQRITAINPDLPGQMADASAAMFELYCGIKISNEVLPDPANPKQTIRQQSRKFFVKGDGVRQFGDRYKLFPEEGPLDLVQLMEQYWLPNLNKNQ
jgi:hypothetical protein